MRCCNDVHVGGDVPDTRYGILSREPGWPCRIVSAGPLGIAASVVKERIAVWWHDLLWGFWNGLTAWIVLIAHVFSLWEGQPFYDAARSGNWYDLGFLLGAGSPILGGLRGRARGTSSSRGA